ncbi:pyridoxamine 5'-phosphate oxidase family protein [Planobispora takensis]|uniref:Oxidoreductase n=1 Tax=Planobispora takensis TaxID=1367882 RepID=A0A8J3T2V9_9ACTN|nr:pyridoxamine 5'-phosphate oxidase family protein [Planobispora takensis]GII03273.1 oxidoreductase [Planobispora takensis]
MRHEGEAAVQRRAGVPRAGELGSVRTRPEIPPVAGEFLRAQRMLVVGAADASGRIWAGPLTGPTGFAGPLDERTVVIDALPGPHDPLAGLFGAAAGTAAGGPYDGVARDGGHDPDDRDDEHDVGMLAIDPATRRRMRINGRARRDGDRLVVRTEQVYANCPKYIRSRTPGADAAPVPGGAHVSGALTAGQRAWIDGADTFFVATRAGGLGADVSHRGGDPGFVRTAGARRLVWPDYLGNSMYMTLGNLELDERCGLLFLGWDTGDALHLTGRARVDWDPGGVPGAERLVGFDVEEVVHVRGAVPLRWAAGDHSRHNPPVIEPAAHLAAGG